MLKLLYVGIGGFIGASLRYGLSEGSAKIFGSNFPYGTLLVNVIGGFLIGLIMEFSTTTKMISPELKLLLTTGVLGGLTTFSTFSHETMSLFNNGKYGIAALNICLNLFLSLGGVAAGKLVLQLFK